MTKSVKNAPVCSVTAAANQFESGLVMLLDPIVQALKESPSREIDGKTPVRDMRLRILLGGMLSHLHRQLLGVITTSDGRTIRNAKQWLEHSDAQASALVAKYESDPSGMQADPDYAIRGAWLRTNETFYANALAMFERLQHVYADAIGEEWAPYERKAPAPVTVKVADGALAEAFKSAAARKAEPATLYVKA